MDNKRIDIYTPDIDRIIHETSVDFSKRMVQHQVNLVQYDNTIPVIKVNLYNNGKPYVLPDLDNLSANVRWSKKDRTYARREVLGCNPERTALYFDVTENMSCFPGEVNPVLELVIKTVDEENNSVINKAHSQSIPVVIDRNPVQKGDLDQSTVDDEYIEIMFQEMQDLLIEMQGEMGGFRAEMQGMLDDFEGVHGVKINESEELQQGIITFKAGQGITIETEEEDINTISAPGIATAVQEKIETTNPQFLPNTEDGQLNEIMVYGETKGFIKDFAFNPYKVVFERSTREGDVYTFKSSDTTDLQAYYPGDLLDLKPDTVYTITLRIVENNLDSNLIINTTPTDLTIFLTAPGSAPITVLPGEIGDYTSKYLTRDLEGMKGKGFIFRVMMGTNNKTIRLKIMIKSESSDGTYEDYPIGPITPSPEKHIKLEHINNTIMFSTANINIGSHVDFFNYVNDESIFIGGEWAGVFFPEAISPNHQESAHIIDGRRCARINPWGFMLCAVWAGKVFKPNTQYTLMWDAMSAISRILGIYFWYTDGTGSSIAKGFPEVFGTLTATSEIGKTVKGMSITYHSGSGDVYVDLDSIKFFEGTVAPLYEPHRGDITQIELKDVDGNPIELYSDAAGTKDEVDVDRGVLSKRIHKVNLKGISISEMAGVAWQKPTATGIQKCNALSPNYLGKPASHAVLSTHFKPGSWNLVGTTPPYNYLMFGSHTAYITIENDAVGIVAGDTDNQKMSKIQSWFANNDVYAYYELQTPIEIPLHPDTIAALKSIPTYSGGTHLWTEQDNGVQPDLWTKEFHDSEIGEKAVLHNHQGDVINPITTPDAVIFKDGYDLEEKLDVIKDLNKIDKLPMADNLIGATVPIMQGGTTKQASADKFGGGEEWIEVLLTPKADETSNLKAVYTFPKLPVDTRIECKVIVTGGVVENTPYTLAKPFIQGYSKELRFYSSYSLFLSEFDMSVVCPTYTIYDNETSEDFGLLDLKMAKVSYIYPFELDSTMYWYTPAVEKLYYRRISENE